MSGFPTLLYKEVLRFSKVGFQTVAAPVLTTLLYLLVFAQALDRHVEVYAGVGYASFLVPGLVMMAMLQNAFANSSSSLIQSKMTGNLVFMLLPPLSHWELFGAYVIAAMIRALVVGIGVILAALPVAHVFIKEPLWLLAFGLAGAGVLGALGVIAAIFSDKFDQLAVFQNFIILPLTFLSGVFYSIHSLPPVWRSLSRFNPVFYMIDGFRYGFFGQSDSSPALGLALVLGFFAVVAGIALSLLASGYKLRN
ncbi:MAG TPA: ABC transporter permease [Burkholderiales bacterium]|nr:ABC transporter permease [Burkholderiales bacterium]